jgi:hypothetical protein
LNRLTEEQREEINEAVRSDTSFFLAEPVPGYRDGVADGPRLGNGLLRIKLR